MVAMTAGGWSRWLRAARRASADSRAPAVLCVGLAVLAVAQALLQSRAAPDGLGPGVPAPLFAVLIALATTAPLGLLWPQPAAAGIIIAAACLLALLATRALTVAGLAALLIVVYRLGRAGEQRVAAARQDAA